MTGGRHIQDYLEDLAARDPVVTVGNDYVLAVRGGLTLIGALPPCMCARACISLSLSLLAGSRSPHPTRPGARPWSAPVDCPSVAGNGRVDYARGWRGPCRRVPASDGRRLPLVSTGDGRRLYLVACKHCALPFMHPHRDLVAIFRVLFFGFQDHRERDAPFTCRSPRYPCKRRRIA